MGLSKISGTDGLSRIAPMFDGWEETMIWSCLQGHMGRASVLGEKGQSAMIEIGDFCFLAGQPAAELVLAAAPPILVPRDRGWEKLIRETLGPGVERHIRYAVRKEPGVFQAEQLRRLIGALPAQYRLERIGPALAGQLLRERWSRDLCAQFEGPEDFCRRGLGFAAVEGDWAVAGASSYTVYTGGMEIEIDTKPEYRRQGLAAACGARLILECMDQGLYPSWDAHDLRSLALTEKLGYHRDRPYPVYLRKN